MPAKGTLAAAGHIPIFKQSIKSPRTFDRPMDSYWSNWGKLEIAEASIILE